MLRMPLWIALTAFLLLPLKSEAQDRIHLSDDFSNCMDASNGVTVEMRACLSEEYRKKNSLLNANFQELLEMLSPPRAEALKVAQRSWIVLRDHDCDFLLGENPEVAGTLDQFIVFNCHVEKTKERAFQLRTMINLENQ